MIRTTITWLNSDEIRILKYIVVISYRNNQEVELGLILYTRELTGDYNLIKQGEEDQKKTDSFSKFFVEYPQQKNYPFDKADAIILDAVRKQYPKSYLRSDTLFFSVDMNKLEVLKNRSIAPCAIYFSPEFSNTDIFMHVGKSFPAPTIAFNFYSNYNSQNTFIQQFYASYPAEDATVLTLFEKIHFE